MKNILISLQIVTCLLLIGLILLQVKGTGLSNTLLFGGKGEFYGSKRGIEKIVFVATIVFTVIFAILSIVLLVV